MSAQNPIEICLIDAGLTSLKNLELPGRMIYLNVHSNSIEKIENISHLIALKHLDLSSNEIRKISGLSACTSLQTLNFSCNQITKIEGLETLKCLKKLNVSYNQINDLSGFKALHKRTHKLTHVELYGNKISSLKHIIQSLCQCNCLTHINLQKGSDGNPVCRIPAYRMNVLSQVPWLECLDGKDKLGNAVNEAVSVHDIPGLDEYIALLEPSLSKSSLGSASSGEGIPDDIKTPRIDTVLNMFSKKNTCESLEETTDSTETEKNKVATCDSDKKHVTDRLESLENKLSSLVELYTSNKLAKDGKREEIVVCIDSESSSNGTTCSNETLVEVPPLKAAVAKKTGQGKSVLRTASGKENIPQERLTVDGKKSKICVKPSDKDPVKSVRSTKDDETFLSLMNEMDAERERRWKAEQASRKLLENIKILQERLIEERKIQEAAITSATKLKSALNIEREARQKFEELSNKLQDESNSMKVQLNDLIKADEANKRTIKSLEIISQKLEKEKTEEGLFNEKRYRELQLDAGGWNRELELLKNTCNKQKDQISQLQELIVSREQEHKNALSTMVSIDSKDVRNLIESEVTKSEVMNAELGKQNMQRLMESRSEYAALEDEFRMALQIEANRYKELYESYEHTTDELNELKGSFGETCQKEVKSRNLVMELTALVKEQKARITEISKSKNDMQLHYKERLCQLEKEVLELRKSSSKLESLQQDKDRMAAHVRGQESVIQGLRSERKLWGQELAQQGASLAQEKGRTDVQLECQNNEISNLQKQLKDSNDTLKIKCKLIDDQTETIRGIKQEISSLSEEKKGFLIDVQKERETQDEDLEQARERIQELQESVNTLTDRKEELKSHVTSMEEELKQSKHELKNFRGQWEDRSKMIDQFEEKVVKMKNSFDEKEKKLIKEKNLENEKASAVEDKLKTLEVRHKSETAAMKHDFNLELRKLTTKKDEEIQKANQQVTQVEEEMREILTETNNQKMNLESRIKQISKAFSEMQNDLT